MSVSSSNLGYARYAGRAARGVQRTNTFDKLARAGFAAKGFLYLVIGGIATRGAFASGEQAVDQRGALQEISQHSFGMVMIALLGVGLVGYALFRIVEAFADPRLKGRGAKNILKRIGYFASGVLHGALAIAAFDLLRGRESGGGSEHWTARLLAQPFGEIAVALLGAFAIVAGINQMKKGVRSDIWKHLDTSRMEFRARSYTRMLGRAGLVAHGIVIAIIGGFLVKAAASSDASQSKGVDGALEWLRGSSGGSLAMGAVALGLLAYAVYCLVRARYFRAATT